jgi:hypothetical protein
VLERLNSLQCRFNILFSTMRPSTFVGIDIFLSVVLAAFDLMKLGGSDARLLVHSPATQVQTVNGLSYTLTSQHLIRVQPYQASKPLTSRVCISKRLQHFQRIRPKVVRCCYTTILSDRVRWYIPRPRFDTGVWQL